MILPSLHTRHVRTLCIFCSTFEETFCVSRVDFLRVGIPVAGGGVCAPCPMMLFVYHAGFIVFSPVPPWKHELFHSSSARIENGGSKESRNNWLWKLVS